MKVYLDMDGVILRSAGTSIWNGDWEIAPKALEFLSWATAWADVIWLTARCRNGDMRNVEQAIRHAIPATTLPLNWREVLIRTKAASWANYKTDGINYDDQFVWIDDNPQPEALIELERRGCTGRWIECNVDLRPDDLNRIQEVLTNRFLVSV